jgi:hypothetical protein
MVYDACGLHDAAEFASGELVSEGGVSAPLFCLTHDGALAPYENHRPKLDDVGNNCGFYRYSVDVARRHRRSDCSVRIPSDNTVARCSSCLGRTHLAIRFEAASQPQDAPDGSTSPVTDRLTGVAGSRSSAISSSRIESVF